MQDKIKLETHYNKDVLEKTINAWLVEKADSISVNDIQVRFSGGMTPTWIIMVWYTEYTKEERSRQEEVMDALFDTKGAEAVKNSVESKN